MDTKNDDSGGSDSLDKSLQKKCVVDDVGQGEGASTTESKETTSSCGSSTADAQCDGQQQRPCNSMKKQKTEKQVGDGSSTGGGGGVGCVTQNAAATLNDDKHTASTVASSPQNIQSLTGSKDRNTSNNTLLTTTVVASQSPTTTSNYSINTAENCSSNQCSSNNNNAFETKVKQISKDLKETTLAETASPLSSSPSSTSSVSSTAATTATINKESPTDDSTTASTSSTSSSATSPECSESITSNALHNNADEGTIDIDGTSLNTSVISDSNDDADSRSKKVRFHPDVKENDGGNRVIPKKKKKLKANSGDEAGASHQHVGNADDEMDLDEEDEYEDEDEFDLAKTIAEAQDYLKEHPLTFVRPCDKSAGRLQNGLLEEDDLPQLTELNEEEDFVEEIIPENGIERILGKQIKGGRVEFLLRFTDQPGLFWESEDFIATQCPSLLNQYEHNRERRQERLMRHVAKRQNLRQRYTDF